MQSHLILLQLLKRQAIQLGLVGLLSKSEIQIGLPFILAKNYTSLRKTMREKWLLEKVIHTVFEDGFRICEFKDCPLKKKGTPKIPAKSFIRHPLKSLARLLVGHNLPQTEQPLAK